MNNKNTKKIREKGKLLPYHYYIENGLWVFTEEFHRERGFCCGNVCKHCAFYPPYQKGNTTLKK